MATICPQRVLQRAISILSEHTQYAPDDAAMDDMINCMVELKDISNALPNKLEVKETS